MKVLLINHFPLTGSGSGTYTRNLAVHLAELGHKVCIIFPENTNAIPEVPGVKLHPVFFTNDTVTSAKGTGDSHTAGDDQTSGANAAEDT